MVPLFLAKISVNRVKPHLREKLIAYQTECGKALYDYWFKGVAVRGDADGVVTDIAAEVRKVLGGIMKGVVHKEVATIVPAMVQAELIGRTHVLARDVLTAGQVLDSEKVPSKGRRGLVVKTANRLRKFCERNDIVPREAQLGNVAKAYVYPVEIVHRWLKEEGRALIKGHLDKLAGQGALKLVSSK